MCWPKSKASKRCGMELVVRMGLQIRPQYRVQPLEQHTRPYYRESNHIHHCQEQAKRREGAHRQ